MNRDAIGWAWVAGQAILLGALIFLPGSDAWSKPGSLRLAANVLFFAGLGLIAVAALRLGGALTPTPVPTRSGELATSGLYRFVRHPIYTGVLLVVAGMTLRSGNWAHVAIAAVTVVFFDRKAAWEEQQLAQHYAGYAEYAARTPKFIPGLRPRR